MSENAFDASEQIHKIY